MNTEGIEPSVEPHPQDEYCELCCPAAEQKEPTKGPWSSSEDEVLVRYVETHGMVNWSKIAKHLGNRVGKQCRERWFNNLSPDINKQPWTDAEDAVILRVQAELGNKWVVISKHLEGRTPNAIKNHWNSKLQKYELVRDADGAERMQLREGGAPPRVRGGRASSSASQNPPSASASPSPSPTPQRRGGAHASATRHGAFKLSSKSFGRSSESKRAGERVRSELKKKKSSLTKKSIKAHQPQPASPGQTPLVTVAHPAPPPLPVVPPNHSFGDLPPLSSLEYNPLNNAFTPALAQTAPGAAPGAGGRGLAAQGLSQSTQLPTVSLGQAIRAQGDAASLSNYSSDRDPFLLEIEQSLGNKLLYPNTAPISRREKHRASEHMLNNPFNVDDWVSDDIEFHKYDDSSLLEDQFGFCA